MTLHMADITEQTLDERHLRNALGRFCLPAAIEEPGAREAAKSWSQDWEGL